MEVIPETKEVLLQETALSDIDKEIGEKLPELLNLVEKRHKGFALNQTWGTNPELFFLYSKLYNCLKSLRESLADSP